LQKPRFVLHPASAFVLLACIHPSRTATELRFYECTLYQAAGKLTKQPEPRGIP
jgi:hypothetical protein